MRQSHSYTPYNTTSPLPGDGWSDPDQQDAAILPNRAQKGRGAVSNMDGRFERQHHQAVDDGWINQLLDDTPRTKTTLGIDGARSVITKKRRRRDDDDDSMDGGSGGGDASGTRRSLSVRRSMSQPRKQGDGLKNMEQRVRATKAARKSAPPGRDGTKPTNGPRCR